MFVTATDKKNDRPWRYNEMNKLRYAIVFIGNILVLPVLVLLSGDGDFDLLLKKIKKDYAVHTEVYGVRSLTANTLIYAADEFHEINEGLLL